MLRCYRGSLPVQYIAYCMGHTYSSGGYCESHNKTDPRGRSQLKNHYTEIDTSTVQLSVENA